MAPSPLLVLLLLAQLHRAQCDPLAQIYRPPQQTTVQASAQAQLVANARAQSQNARPWVLNYLTTQVLPSLRGTSLEGLSGEDLLARLDWEMKRLPIIHNGPLDGSDQTLVQDDSDLGMTLSNNYLQNVCQRWALGTPSESMTNLVAEHGIMTTFMDLPGFARGSANPTLREANNCVMYLATNLRKTHCGNFIFGSVTYVVNPLYRDKFAVAPFDTGAFARAFPTRTVFGTLEDYYHVFKNHVEVLRSDFGALFRRWYLEGPPPEMGQFPYFEVAWLGNAWVPESLLYIIAKFSGGPGKGVFGTLMGRALQDTMRYRGVPVIWADGDNSGMLIDGTVNMIEGGRLGQEASDYFNDRWDSGISWQDFYGYSPEYLKFFYPQYERKELCDWAEQNPGNMIMGHDRLGNCVYWVWHFFQTKYECLNDGTCEKSDSSRATFDSEQECLANCGSARWGCNIGSPGMRPGSHYCAPEPGTGSCGDVNSCEANCEQRGTCPTQVYATAPLNGTSAGVMV